jgi:hypothetical protein
VCWDQKARARVSGGSFRVHAHKSFFGKTAIREKHQLSQQHHASSVVHDL